VKAESHTTWPPPSLPFEFTSFNKQPITNELTKVLSIPCAYNYFLTCFLHILAYFLHIANIFKAQISANHKSCTLAPVHSVHCIVQQPITNELTKVLSVPCVYNYFLTCFLHILAYFLHIANLFKAQISANHKSCTLAPVHSVHCIVQSVTLY